MGRDYGKGMRKMMANPNKIKSPKTFSKEKYKMLNSEDKKKEEK